MDPEEHEWKDLKPVQEALKVVMEPEGGDEGTGGRRDVEGPEPIGLHACRQKPYNGPISAAGREPSRLRGYWGSD